MPPSEESPLPRVLFTAQMAPSSKFGSFEEQAFSLCRAFHERSGVFIPLYLSGLGPTAGEAYRAAGLLAESLDLSRFRLSTLGKLARLVRLHGIEVVHWNFYEPIKNGYVWGLSLLTPSVRHFFTDHTSRPSGQEASGPNLKATAKGLLYRRYEKVFCVSDFVSRSLQSGGAWPNVVRWVHLVNTERFSPSPSTRQSLRKQYGADERFVALVVAHLTPEKGVDVAIRAIASLPESVVLWVVGEGQERARFEDLVRERSLQDRVRFFGPQWDVAPFMRAADCLVCPSLWAEAAGLVNIEALACGLPVVASRTGGIPEYVADGKTGILFPPGDDRQLALALGKLAADPIALRTLSVASREDALDRFSIQNRIDNYLDFYRSPTSEPEHADVVRATA